MYACSKDHGDHKSSVDVEESMWALDEDLDNSNDASHSLMISLARPAITTEETTWKKGTVLAYVPVAASQTLTTSNGRKQTTRTRLKTSMIGIRKEVAVVISVYFTSKPSVA